MSWDFPGCPGTFFKIWMSLLSRISLAISLYLESKNDLLWFFSVSDASLYGPSCFLRFFCGGAPLRILFSSQYASRHCHINSIKKERWMLWQSIQNFKIETGYKNLWPTFSSHFLPTTWISFTKEFCCNLAKRHPYLRWSWERTIDSIRWCYNNQIGIKKSGPIGPVCLLSWF